MDIDEISVLDSLYRKTSSQDWTKPWDLDNIHCNEPGITCDDMGHVIGINVKGFGLTGSIPEEIGFLKYLKTLDLSDNDLTGFLPSDLRFAPLERMDISGNRLIGLVPLMLCTKLGINGNGLISKLGCNHIACPVGYYSSTGTGSWSNTVKCLPCRKGDGLFLASKKCGEESSYRWTEDYTVGKMFLIIFLAIFAAWLILF